MILYNHCFLSQTYKLTLDQDVKWRDLNRQRSCHYILCHRSILILFKLRNAVINLATVKSCRLQKGLQCSLEALKHWKACIRLRIYSDTLQFYFQSPPILSFHLTGERGWGGKCWYVTFAPWARVMKTGRWEAVAAAAALIRGWALRSVSCTVHQRRSASQPESQMTPSTCFLTPSHLPPVTPLNPYNLTILTTNDWGQTKRFYYKTKVIMLQK